MSNDLATLHLPEPVGLQTEWMDSEAARKLLRIGRRGSKTRFAFVAGLSGHGPGWEDNTPLHGGVLQGGDVVWICPTYSNLSTVLWREEIEPRMGHLPWVTLNKALHDVEIPGLGALMLRSGDRAAIDSVRGVGKRLRGVIVDEAAHMDLRGALQDVILPALLDNGGWLIIMSTTNAGQDGGYDDTGAPQIPSYFNLLCAEVIAGKRGPEWRHFHGTAYDNPTLDHDAIDGLIAEYPPDSPKLKQEVFAELLETGVGLALPGLSEARHMVPAFTPPEHWNRFAGFDWGYHHPWTFGHYSVDDDGQVYKRDSLMGRLDLPEQIDAAVRAAGVDPTKLIIHASPDAWRTRVGDKGKIQGQYEGPTIAERLLLLGWRLKPAADARVAGLNNLREYTYIEPSKPGSKPRFLWMDTPGNKACLAQIARMPLNPKAPEDALKVDADAAGRGGDDYYDECVSGDTMVLTGRGWYPIAVLVGTVGTVLTPIGWQRYSGVRQTQEQASIWRLTTDGGAYVDATYTHDVLTTGGWSAVGGFREGAGVSWEAILAQPGGLLPSSDAVAASRGVDGVLWSNPSRDADSPPRREPREQRARELGSITSQGAQEATQGHWGTVDQEAGALREDSTDDEGMASERGRPSKSWADSPRNVEGRPLSRDDLSAVWEALYDTNAQPDEQVLPSELQGQGATCTATGVTGIEYLGKGPVYNMEVERAHCFVVNGGLVVHNCRYALMSRPINARLPVEPPYKVAHVARKIVIGDDGKLVKHQPEPKTVDELVQWAQQRRQQGRVPTFTQRVPRKR